MSLTLKVRYSLAQTQKQITFENNQTVRQAIELICKKSKLQCSEDYTIFIPSSPECPKGLWLEDQKLLGDLPQLHDKGLIELKLHPYSLNFCLSDGTPKWMQEFSQSPMDKIVLCCDIDLSDPLIEYIPIFQRTIDVKSKEEYIFQQVTFENHRPIARWLNVNIPLTEQNLDPESFICLIPASSLMKKTVESMHSPQIEGWLNKTSLKEGKCTKMVKRWCVVKDNFLFYFAGQMHQTPNGVLCLEYHTVPDRKDLQFELIPVQNSFSKAGKKFSFVAESEKDAKEWVRIVREKSVTGAGKKIFGIPLTKLFMRKDRSSDIPSVVEKTVKYLENHLDLEGIFRISASAASIEKFKDEFDLGLDVDLSRVTDPHTVSGLLKLFLRQLPEPLFTFDLFDDFIRSFDANDMSGTQKRLRVLIHSLPLANRRTLEFLASFLKKVGALSDKNLMTFSNLAVVFGPNLLRPREESLELEHSATINSIVETLFKYQDQILYAEEPQTQATPPPVPSQRPSLPNSQNLVHSQLLQQLQAKQSSSATTSTSTTTTTSTTKGESKFKQAGVQSADAPGTPPTSAKNPKDSRSRFISIGSMSRGHAVSKDARVPPSSYELLLGRVEELAKQRQLLEVTVSDLLSQIEDNNSRISNLESRLSHLEEK